MGQLLVGLGENHFACIINFFLWKRTDLALLGEPAFSHAFGLVRSLELGFFWRYQND